MAKMHRELGFDTLLAITSGLMLAAYMLGAILDPLPAVAVGFILVVIGVMAFVPPQARATAVVLGVVAVGVAGIVIPRAVTSFIDFPTANELMVSLIGSGLVLLLTFGLLRLTAFRPENRTAA